MGEQTENAPAELLQGDALAADKAAKAKQAQESAARVRALLQTEFDAMLGIAPGLRGDYQYMTAFLDHAVIKI